ncbi:unnamed protein product, partial [Allacma fusca]
SSSNLATVLAVASSQRCDIFELT